MIAVGLEGYLFDALGGTDRILFVLGGVVFAYPGYYTDLLGVAILFLSLAIFYFQTYQKRKTRGEELIQKIKILEKN